MYTVTRLIVDAHQSVTHRHQSGVLLPSLTILSPFTGVTITSHQCHYHHSPISLPPFTNVTIIIHPCRYHNVTIHKCYYHHLPMPLPQFTSFTTTTHQRHYHHSPVSLPLSPTSAVWCRQQDWLAKRSLVTSSPFTHNNTTPALAISHQRHY